jgi:hypothetical protein
MLVLEFFAVTTDTFGEGPGIIGATVAKANEIRE